MDIETIVRKFGGQTAMGRAVGVGQSTVANWVRHGYVPAQRGPRIAEAALRLNPPLHILQADLLALVWARPSTTDGDERIDMTSGTTVVPGSSQVLTQRKPMARRFRYSVTVDLPHLEDAFDEGEVLAKLKELTQNFERLLFELTGKTPASEKRLLSGRGASIGSGTSGNVDEIVPNDAHSNSGSHHTHV